MGAIFSVELFNELTISEFSFFYGQIIKGMIFIVSVKKSGE